MFDSCWSEFGCRRRQGKIQRPAKGADAGDDPEAQKNKSEFLAAFDSAIQVYKEAHALDPILAAGTLAMSVQNSLQRFAPPGLLDSDRDVLSNCVSWVKSHINSGAQWGQSMQQGQTDLAPQAQVAQQGQPQGAIPEVAGSGLFGALAGLLGRNNVPKVVAAPAPSAARTQADFAGSSLGPSLLGSSLGASVFAQKTSVQDAAPVVSSASAGAAPADASAPLVEAVATEPEKANALQLGSDLLSKMESGKVDVAEISQMAQQSESLKAEEIGEESEEWSKQATQMGESLLEKASKLESGEQSEEIKNLIKLAKEMAKKLIEAAALIAEKLQQASNEENAALDQTKGSMFKPR